MAAKFLAAVLILSLHSATSLCPHESSLSRWSESSTWTNNPGGVPSEGSSVTINNNVLLDVNPGFDLDKIEIEAGGQLVFSPNVKISLRVRYILVKGRLDIGSESCPYTGKATITLIGLKNETYNIDNFGQKFLGVEAGGTLEIHGEYKRPWTKLNSTLVKLPEDKFIFRDKVTKEDNIRGLLVYSLDPATGQPDRAMGVFGIRRQMQAQTDKDIAKFIGYVDAIPDGNIVAIAIRKSIISDDDKKDISKLYEAVEILAFGSVTGKSKIRDLVFYDGYALILVKGNPAETIEEFESYKAGGVKQTSTATMIRESSKMKIEVTSFTSSRGHGKSFVDFQVTNTEDSLPIINVVDDVSTWKEGDEIVIASTDYNWKQHEFATIVSCDSCTNHQVRISLTPEFTHYGEIYNNVDMRAEVAVLNRNVVVIGDMANGDDTNGGHIKVRKDFEAVRVENAELAHLGQTHVTGSYPMHWHMCETPKNPTYIRSCAIHHTYARCVTVHGTHTVTVSDNSCVESLGHGFFLEDGGERDTVFDGNLGFGQRAGKLIFTDKDPSTFWITNPYTVLRNNAAAGGEGNGIWVVFPEKPMGLSATKNFMKPGEAKRTAIKEFTNNVAHSNRKVGLKIEGRLLKDGRAMGVNMYQPSSKVEINRLTAYKNNMRNALIRGDNIHVNRASLSDSPKGIKMMRGLKGKSYLQNSVILGDSENVGKPTVDKNGTLITDRSLPFIPMVGISAPRYGLLMRAGHLLADSNWFGDFHNTGLYKTGAITSDSGFGPNSLMNSITNAQFGFSDPSDGNRLQGQDGKPYDVVQDSDGSLTTHTGAWIVEPIPFHITSNCEVRSNWNLAVCKERFGQIRIWMSGPKTNKMTMHRLDDMESLTLVKFQGLHFNVMGGKQYGVSWDDDVPKEFAFRGLGINKDNGVVLGVCVPRDAVLNARIFGFRATEVSSIDQVIDDNVGGKYFIDKEVGMAFAKLIGKESKTDGSECVGGFCPGMKIMVKSGDLSDGNCIDRYTSKYVKDDLRILLEQLRNSERSISIPADLAMTSERPPLDFGAGATR